NDEARYDDIVDQRVYELLKQCTEGKDPSDYLFTREKDAQGRAPKKGGHISDFRIDWTKVTERAGAPGLMFHDLRRTGVRNMRRDGVSEKVAMRISGHRTRSIFERYNIVDPSDLKDAGSKME